MKNKKNIIFSILYILLFLIAIFGYHTYLFIDWYYGKYGCNTNNMCVQTKYIKECVNKSYASKTKTLDKPTFIYQNCKCSWYNICNKR